MTSDRFEKRSLLGRGGMAEVHRAWDKVLKREVALKILYPQFLSDETHRKRLAREAHAAAKLDHPNIVRVYDFIDDGEQCCLVSEIVEGTPLNQVLADNGPMFPELAAFVASVAASALAHAHERGVVHRDLKPANIMISREGVVKIVDFGIAQVLHATVLTQSHEILGTPQYMAPEQVHGKDAGPQSDVFSLGAILYELCTGVGAFAAPNAVATMKRITEGVFPPLEYKAPSAGNELTRIVAQCLAVDPVHRPGGMTALAQALAAIRSVELFNPTEKTLARFMAGSATDTVVLNDWDNRRAEIYLEIAQGEIRHNAAVALDALNRLLAVKPDHAVGSALLLQMLKKNRTRQWFTRGVGTAAVAMGLAILAGSIWVLNLRDENSKYENAYITNSKRPKLKKAFNQSKVEAPPLVAGPQAPPTRQPMAPVVEPKVLETPVPVLEDAWINVLPWGIVSIDGKPVGRTPPPLKIRLPVGEHRLTAQGAPGIPPIEDNFVLKAGVPFRKVYELP